MKEINWRKPIIIFGGWVQGSKRIKYLKEILSYENLSEEALKRMQKEKLEKLILHSYEHIPYYREIFEKIELVKDGMVNMNNFTKVPFLTKDILREKFEELQDERYTKKKGSNTKSKLLKNLETIWVGRYENTSGGSTGEPAVFIQDRKYFDWSVANKMYYKKSAGQEIGEKELRFWGSERDLLEGKETFIMRFRNWIYNRKEFNTFKLSQEEMKEYVEKWNMYKPHWVESYVQAMYEFGKFIKEHNYEIYSPDNGILTSAGVLDDEKRKLLEEVFKCSVYNRYGSREVGDMACGTGELKINVWSHLIEIIDSKVYVTLLTNFTMPIIRYDIGDLAEEGSKWGYIKNIKGRVNTMIRTKKRSVDTAAVTSMFYYREDGSLFKSFSKYQVIQEKIDHINIKIVVKDKELWEEESKEIENLFHKVFGDDVKVTFEIVNDIEPSKSGKYMYILSKLEENK